MLPERTDLQPAPVGRFPGWVYDLGLTGQQLALYGVYAAFANDAAGTAVRPAVRDICERLSAASPSDVYEWRRVLLEKGAILVERQYGQGGKALPPKVTLPRTPQPVDNPVDNVDRVAPVRVAETSAEPNQGLGLDLPTSGKSPPHPGTGKPRGGASDHSSGSHDPDQGHDPEPTSQVHSKIITLGLQNSTVQPGPDTGKGEEDFSQKVSKDDELIRRAFARIASQRFVVAQDEGRIEGHHTRHSWIRRTIENLHTERGDEARRELVTLRAATELDRLVAALTPPDVPHTPEPKGPPPIPYFEPVSSADSRRWCTAEENVAHIRAIRADPRKHNPKPEDVP